MDCRGAWTGGGRGRGRGGELGETPSKQTWERPFAARWQRVDVIYFILCFTCFVLFYLFVEVTRKHSHCAADSNELQYVEERTVLS